jgi:putative transcriptional regulator
LGIDLDLDVDIYWGGPVSQGIIWMLHDASWSMDTTMIIDDHWAMTSHKDMFHELAVQGTPDEWRLFSGFSVWGPGQLEGELEGQAPWTAKSSWLHCQGLTPTWSFGYDQDHDLWAAAISLSSQQAVREWIA